MCFRVLTPLDRAFLDCPQAHPTLGIMRVHYATRLWVCTPRQQAKIWQSGFFWPTMYEDTREFIRRCRRCQLQVGNTACNAMPPTYNLQVELFDVWGIDFKGPFLKSHDCEYILVAVDYVSKWVEALPCRAADAKHAMKMFHEIIFPCFGTPRMVISDGGPISSKRPFVAS